MSRINIRRLLLLSTVFAVIGVIAVLVGQAGGAQHSLEAEDATLQTAFATVDSEASNGSYIEFRQPEPLPDIPELNCDDPSQHFVAPGASPDGAGTCDDPVDLQTIIGWRMGQPVRVQPGDIVWVRGGRYRATYTTGKHYQTFLNDRFAYFRSNLAGEPDNPIIVRAVPGERVTLYNDSSEFIASGTQAYEPVILELASKYTWYWGLELSYERPTKVDDGVVNGDCRSSGRVGNATKTASDGYLREPFLDGYVGNKYINMVMHDSGSVGLSTLRAAKGIEVHGNLVYYTARLCAVRNTVYSPNSYIQKDFGEYREFHNNIMFDPAEWGYQVNSSDGDNMSVRGNTIFTTGHIALPPGVNELSSSYSIYSHMLHARGGRTDNSVVENNKTYYHGITIPSDRQRGADIGYTNSPSCSPSFIWRNNYHVGGQGVRIWDNCQGRVTFEDNFILGNNNPSYGQFYYPDNNTWINSGDTSAYPTENAVFYDKNKYELGRTNITIYNWEDLSSVQVDLQETDLESGQRYEIRDVQNFYGDPLVSGTYQLGQTATIPMTGLTKVQPFASNLNQNIPHTAPFFGVFLVLPLP